MDERKWCTSGEWLLNGGRFALKYDPAIEQILPDAKAFLPAAANACEGISTEALESGAVQALVEAAREARQAIWDHVPEDAGGSAAGILSTIDEAIAPFAETETE